MPRYNSSPGVPLTPSWALSLLLAGAEAREPELYVPATTTPHPLLFLHLSPLNLTGLQLCSMSCPQWGLLSIQEGMQDVSQRVQHQLRNSLFFPKNGQSIKLRKTQLSLLGAFPTPAVEIPQAIQSFRKRVWNFLTGQRILETSLGRDREVPARKAVTELPLPLKCGPTEFSWKQPDPFVVKNLRTRTSPTAKIIAQIESSLWGSLKRGWVWEI